MEKSPLAVYMSLLSNPTKTQIVLGFAAIFLPSTASKLEVNLSLLFFLRCSHQLRTATGSKLDFIMPETEKTSLPVSIHTSTSLQSSNPVSPFIWSTHQLLCLLVCFLHISVFCIVFWFFFLLSRAQFPGPTDSSGVMEWWQRQARRGEGRVTCVDTLSLLLSPVRLHFSSGGLSTLLQGPSTVAAEGQQCVSPAQSLPAGIRIQNSNTVAKLLYSHYNT